MTHEEEICSKCPLHDKGCAYELRELQCKCTAFEHIELREAAKELVGCVERYTYPKGKKLCRRSELLIACNKLKGLL